MNWRFLGSIHDARNSGCSGVYMIVHRGKYDRVVYVGVSINVGRRISEHYEGYLRGNRTIYNVDKDEDVYSLMSVFFVRNHIKHYIQLAKESKIWASTTIHSYSPSNLLNKNQTFDREWQDIVSNKYLPNLVVWALPMADYTYEKATEIETVIQRRLIDTFDLRGFFNVKHISLLGKMEHPNLKKIPINILPPDIDEVSRLALNDMNLANPPSSAKSLAIKQLSSEIKKRDAISKVKRQKRKQILARYKNQGAKWTQEDLEKLRVMVADFDLSPTDISKFLDRHPTTIAKRIETNDKLSNRMWRENIKWLT